MKKYIIVVIVVTLTVIILKPSKMYLTDKYYSEGKFIENIDISTLKNENYILYTYNPYCSFETPCEDIFKAFMLKNKIDIISLPFSKFKETYLYSKIKYAPSIIIVKKRKVVAYLDANSDKDTKKYQDEKSFETWVKKYVYLNKNITK